jgi:hypothetical protein
MANSTNNANNVVNSTIFDYFAGQEISGGGPLNQTHPMPGKINQKR